MTLAASARRACRPRASAFALLLAASVIQPMCAQAAVGYQDTDLLLVFRKDGAANDLMFDLGSVSNYLGRAYGTTLSVTNWDTNLVTASFGGSLSGVRYVLMATTPQQAPLRVWLSDGDGSGVPTDETFSRWSGQRSKINAIGAGLNNYPDIVTNQSLALPPGDPGSYTYIASGGGALDVATMGGSAPFVVEQDVGSGIRLFELKASSADPKPVAAEVGGFILATDGTLTFTAGFLVPLSITQPPTPSSQMVECGSTAVFTMSAAGDPGLAYQWRLNGTPVSGATNPTLTLSHVSFADAGTYTVLVSNLGGATVVSSGAVLTVQDTTPPALPGNLVLARTDASGATNVILTAMDACDGSVSMTCTPASGSTFPLGATTVNCTAVDSHGNSTNGSFTVTVVPGFTYQDTDLLLAFRKDGFSDVLFNLGSVSNYLGLPTNGAPLPVLNWDLGLVNRVYATNLTGVKYIFLATTPPEAPLRVWLSDATLGDLPTDETFSRWSGQRSKINAIGTAAASYYNSSNQAIVLPATDPGSYTYIASGGGALDVATLGGSAPFMVEQDLGGPGTRLIELKASSATPKPAAAEVGGLAATADGQIHFTAGYLPVEFVQQPAPATQTVECGTSAALTVVANGTPPLNYQWYLNGATPVGGNSPVLAFSPVSLAQAGSYSVVVSNNQSVASSLAAILTVVDTTPPSFGAITAMETQGSAGVVDVKNCASNALPGTVNIAVQVSHVCGLAGPPALGLTNGANGLSATYVNESPAGTFNYTWTVSPIIPAGTWTATVTASDTSGNSANTTFTLCLPVVSQYTVTGLVELESFAGTNRDVIFIATGGASPGTNWLQTNTLTLTFLTNGAPPSVKYAPYSLTVPVNTTNLSAKTDWNLRRRRPVTFPAGPGVVNFTNTAKLLGGDISPTPRNNVVNAGDRTSLLAKWGASGTNAIPVDITGNGTINAADRTALLNNWGKTGDNP